MTNADCGGRRVSCGWAQNGIEQLWSGLAFLQVPTGYITTFSFYHSILIPLGTTRVKGSIHHFTFWFRITCNAGENIKTNYLNAENCPKSMDAVRQLLYRLDDLHPCEWGSSFSLSSSVFCFFFFSFFSVLLLFLILHHSASSSSFILQCSSTSTSPSLAFQGEKAQTLMWWRG